MQTLILAAILAGHAFVPGGPPPNPRHRAHSYPVHKPHHAASAKPGKAARHGRHHA